MTTTYDKKSIADYTLNFATPKEEPKFSLDTFKELFGGVTSDGIDDPNFKKAVEFLIKAIPSPVEKPDVVEDDIERVNSGPPNEFNNDNGSSEEEGEVEGDGEQDDKEVEGEDINPGAIAAAIAASKSSDKDGTDDKNTATKIKVADVPTKTALVKNPLDKEKEKEKDKNKGRGDGKPQENTENAPAQTTEIDSGDTVTYITPQRLVYIYNKRTRTIYEYEESLENKEDNLREVRLEGENTFQIKIGDMFETINESNIKEYYKFVTENNEITKYFFRDMLNASTAVLKDIKKLFPN
jgi:hypothetical protein